jgi:oligopeptide transport system permease protein
MDSRWKRLLEDRRARAAFAMLFCLLFFSLFGPLFSSHSYSDIHLNLKNHAPCSHFWFGTDELGRDLFTRVWWGARISLFIGIAAAIIDAGIGVIWGAAAAQFGGKIEELMMRFCDVLHAIPYLLIVILLTVIRGSGIFTILIAMTLTGWINMARIVRGQILQLKQTDFIAAARTIGASPARILFFHLIPNAMGPILATMTLTVPTAIFTEAFLSFLGLGVQAPIASWGVMVNDGAGAMRYYPWRLFFPAAMITWTMFSFNLLGSALQKTLDPKESRA